jgi:hypothetical protein
MRKGLNCTMSYVRAGVTRTYSVRAGDLAYGVQMVSAEDAGRVVRSYYPHKTASQQFSVQVLLKDWDERNDFMNWLGGYAQWAIDPSVARTAFPFINVRVPGRAFYQTGLPLTGFEWGVHTGMMTFSPVIVFETGLSPGQQGTDIVVSSVLNRWAAFASDPAIQYFYPFGTQLASDQVGVDYTQVLPVTPVPPPAVAPPTGQPVQVGGPVVVTIPPPPPAPPVTAAPPAVVPGPFADTSG